MLLLALSALLLLLVPLQPALADNSTTSVSDTSKSNSSISKSNGSFSINVNIESKSDDSAEESSETLPIALPLVASLLNSNDAILKHSIFNRQVGEFPHHFETNSTLSDSEFTFEGQGKSC